MPDCDRMALAEGNKIFNVDNCHVCTTMSNKLWPALSDSPYSKVFQIEHATKKHAHDTSYVQGKGLFPLSYIGGPAETVRKGRPG